MISLKHKSKGFTIVELLIVIVVIGILATLVIITFSGIQQKARDTKRKTDVNAVTSHVEAFYADKGFYPTFGQLSDATWRTTNMKGLDPEALKDPKGGAIQRGASAADKYGYNDTTDGTTACASSGTTDDANCLSFVLSANLEGGGTYQKKSN